MSGVAHALHGRIAIMITSLDPGRSFPGKYNTVVVNAHGCGVIFPERLEKGTPVAVELISNGQTKKARVVLTIAIVEGVSWLLGLEFDSPAGGSGRLKIRRQIGGFKRESGRFQSTGISRAVRVL